MSAMIERRRTMTKDAAFAEIERLEEAAHDHECPSFALCPKHATLEIINLFECAYCEIERLVEERDNYRNMMECMPKNPCATQEGDRDDARRELATLRAKVTERITKWRTDAESYPGTVVGQYASTAVKLCADELQVDMDALAEAEGTPLQLFDPEEFERRVAFIEGPKR